MTRRVSGLYIVLALAVLAFMTVTPALASNVTYSTSGSFSGAGTSCGADCVVFGGAGNTLTLSFAGIPSSAVTGPTNVSAGFITATVTGNGAAAAGNFTLTIDQTVPSVGSGGLNGTLSGAISFDSSNGTLDFTNTTLNLNGVIYTLQQPPGGYELVAPNTLEGETSIQMRIQVPEPAFFGLTGLGFFGLAGIAYRRYRQGRA